MTGIVAKGAGDAEPPDPASRKSAATERLHGLVSYLLLRIGQRYNATINTELREPGLTPMTARVIASLYLFGELTVNELCVHAIAEQSAMSRALDRMQAEGLLERRKSTEDSRVRVVRLTPAGAARFDPVWEIMTKANEDMLDGIGPGDRETLRRILGRIHRNIRVNPF